MRLNFFGNEHRLKSALYSTFKQLYRSRIMFLADQTSIFRERIIFTVRKSPCTNDIYHTQMHTNKQHGILSFFPASLKVKAGIFTRYSFGPFISETNVEYDSFLAVFFLKGIVLYLVLIDNCKLQRVSIFYICRAVTSRLKIIHRNQLNAATQVKNWYLSCLIKKKI